jgi:hypothetical protein
MCVQTFVTGRARPVASKPPALWHAPKVVLVKKLTCVTLFAEPTKPVLAYGRQPVPTKVRRGGIWGTKVQWTRRGVSQRAVKGAEGAPRRS